MIFVRFTFVLAVALLPVGLLPNDSEGERYRADNGSRLWIEGTSTLNNFTCLTFKVDGFTQSPSVAMVGNENRIFGRVMILVRTLDCGNGLMNRDMYAAMKESQHPLITFELERAEVLDKPSNISLWMDVRVSGKLTIAGVQREIELIVKAKALRDGRYRILGRLPLSMHDFGIEPPSAFFGIIKADDKLVVHFDLFGVRSQDQADLSEQAVRQ